MHKTSKTCLTCRHFHNTPQYLEAVYKGLSSLSSGWASVRKDDGICEERELYLSASASCMHHAARQRDG